MTPARDAIHTALVARLKSVSRWPVRVGLHTANPPYIRIGEDTEEPEAPNKLGEASRVRPLVSVHSTSFKEVREEVRTIAESLRTAPLEPEGFRVIQTKLELIAPMMEYDATHTIYGERLLYAITTEPTG